MRTTVMAAVFGISLIGLASADKAAAAIRKPTHIAPQSLGAALRQLADDRGLQVLYFSDAVRDLESGGASGNITTDEALRQVLSGTGLIIRFIDESTVSVEVPAAVERANGAQPIAQKQLSSSVPLWTRLRLAQATPSTPALASTPAEQSEGKLEEIIVTAQKKSERLKDVPVPVTAVSANTLLDQNQTKAEDFFSSIPGVNLQTTRNRANLAIRGITTGPVTGNPIVGYTIDDVPFGSSTGQGGLFGGAPDIDPSELARIEVLRGPQGTLYGAGSMGGLVKYVTVDPSTDRLNGAVAMGATSISGADDLGGNLRGSINIPLGETFAVRAGAFMREEPGYIDNVVTGQRDVNKIEVSGGRISALWLPSDSFSAKLNALYQDRNMFGSANVDSRLGSGFRQSDQHGAGRGSTENQLYSATLRAELGAVEITSLTAYADSSNTDFADFSATAPNNFWPVLYPDAGLETFATQLLLQFQVSKFSEELRLAFPVGDHLDLIVGGFYTREAVKYSIEANAADPADGRVIGTPIDWKDSFTFAERAAFTNLTARFTDRFDVQVGARYSENRQNMHHREWGAFSPGGYLESYPRSTGHALTYQVTPRLKLSPDHMFYARLATGYRPGGPNANCGAEVPCLYLSDETVNYELGAKGDLFDGSLSYDVSVFNIDWKDIQVTQFTQDGGFTYNANANEASSRGVEFSFDARPVDGLTLSLWAAYTDAKLSEAFSLAAAVFAAKGDRLPFSSRYSGRFSASYELLASGDLSASVGGSLTYVGDREGEFVVTADEAALRQQYPSYVQVDLNAGVKLEDWKVNLFVQNATDKRALTGGGYNNQYNFNQYWFTYVQPRSIGVSVERKF